MLVDTSIAIASLADNLFFDNRSSDAEQTSKAENCEHANISYLKRTTKKIKTIRADINKFHIVDKSRSEKNMKRLQQVDRKVNTRWKTYTSGENWL